MILNRIKEVAKFLNEKIESFNPEVGAILGSGLGTFADSIDVKYIVNYCDIPNFPVSTVAGHSGRFVIGYVAGRKVIAMQGRFHYYEGYSMEDVTLPVRVMKLLGIETLLVSNAAGGINTSFQVGDLMIIRDQINLLPNPLIGKNIEEFGTRFPDMHDCFDPELINIATNIADEEGIKLQYGVYVGSSGPTFETQAEYRYFKIIGADATGMSTTPEVIVARHASIRVFGVSIITNCGLSDEKGDHEDVQLQGAKASCRMTTLFTKLIERL